MVGTFLESLLHGLKVAANVALDHIWALIAVAALLSAILVTLYAIDRERVLGLWDRLRGYFTGWAGWMGALALTGFGMYALTLVQATVELRNDWKRQSPYSDQESLSYGTVYQQGPVSSYVQEKTFTRRLVLPKEFIDRLGGEGVSALAPYLGDTSASNVLGLDDQFVRSGDQVIFTRNVRRLEETPVMLKEANVEVAFETSLGGAGSASLYTSDFKGVYKFQNPLATPVQARFRFPLPSNQTAITGFELKVNGQSVNEPDEQGAYSWEGELPAQGAATATVHYRVKGSGDWSFNIASNRRRIEKFHLTVSSDRMPKLVKNALYPSGRTGESYSWDLQNAISDQEVHLHFDVASIDATQFEKATSFSAAALAALVLGCVFWARLFRLELTPMRLALAAFGGMIGYGMAAVFVGYMAGWLALLLGALVVAVLAIRALGTSFALPIGLASASVLAFLTERHAGLAIGCAAVLIVVIALGRVRPGSSSIA